MLRVVQARSAVGLKDYFTGGLSGGDIALDDGRCLSWWSGVGASMLGLSGEVTRKDFAALADNVNPRTGEQLTPRMKADRRVAYDFNFHASKSVSLLAMVAWDHRLIDAVSDAESFTMRALERYAGTRVRVHGLNENRVTGNLVCANFLHLTARPVDGIPDPHVHVHAVVFNTTHDAVEGRWKAVQLGGVVKQAPYFQALFHSALAKRVMALGYEVAKAGNSWEIAGVGSEITARYSRRSQVIKERVLRDGVNDPARKATYGARTRESKAKSASRELVERDWRSRLSDEEYLALRHLRSNGVRAVDPAVIDESVRLAVLRTFQRSAMVEESMLLAKVLEACPGQLTVAEIRQRYDAQRVIVREEAGRRTVTTKEVLRAERDLVDAVVAGMGTRTRLLPSQVQEISGLSESEAKAARRILESEDLVTVVRSAGVGQQGELVERLSGIVNLHTGHEFIALSATGAAVAGELRDARAKSAVTVAEFLLSEKLHEGVRKGVLWVSDAHRLPVASLEELVQFGVRTSSRIVLSGDRLSRGAVFGGNVLDILERHAGVKPVEVSAARVQRGEAARVVQALLDGRTKDAQHVLEKSGHFKSVPFEELGLHAGRALAAVLTPRARGLVVAPTKAMAESATEACRAALKAKGRIARERTVSRLVSEYLSNIDKTRAVTYRPGMVIRFAANSGRFRSGQEWTVTGTNVLGHVELRRGVKLAVLPKNRPERFDVFRREEIQVGVGDRVRITKSVRTRALIDIPLGIVSRKHAKPHRKLRAGSVHRVKDFTALGHLVLDNGMVLKKGSAFEYAYAQTPGAALAQSADHVVVAVPRNDESLLTAQQLAHAASAGRRSVTVVTDRRTIEGLRTDGPPKPSALDVTDSVPPMDLHGRVRDIGERLAKVLHGVRSPSREYERALER